MTGSGSGAGGRRSGEALLDAVELMDRLRRIGPWEAAQTHDSLRRYLLEETYELLDAIEGGSRADLLEELADILLQVLFHARIAADDPVQPFDIDDVARAFTAKISARSAGVLAGDTDLAAQIEHWETTKAAEKARMSVFDGVATSQPALALTQKVMERLDAAGFPHDLIPASVLTVDLTAALAADPDGSVEDRQRCRIVDFMARVRAAESALRAAGVRAPTAADWRRMLGEPSVISPSSP
ncbi:MazG family protein [Williamsia sp. CHRR-6]|uniref:MazG family protein n=1 Tax=Williamsia sp. CHRR-6 TaxID=2835871 RepID=UPI001BD9CCCA|nr:MazG family protein [Williamsia sp. CHRR-6]MBT0566683.1 MazG family protein [Williamsia sp. CHRR-6]